MKVQTVKFPQTPEATLEEVKKLKVFIDKYNVERFNTAEMLPAEMIAVMWHSAQLDFIEALDDYDNRVGIMMVSIYTKGDGTRGATVMVSYIDEENRKQGLFRKMVELARIIYRARNITVLDIPVFDDVDLSWFGEVHIKTYRSEL